jgi:hypothetical protein
VGGGALGKERKGRKENRKEGRKKKKRVGTKM